MIRTSTHRPGRATACALLLAYSGCAPQPFAVGCTIAATVAALPAELREASGVAIDARDRIWVIADSGAPFLYSIGADNQIAERIRLLGATNDDWEDLASGPCGGAACLYIGEIGDNLHTAPTRAVLRVPEPAPGDSAVRAERFAFRFPDGPSDAEALVVLPDETMLVVTKGRNREIGVYRYAPPLIADSIVTLERVAALSRGIVQLPAQITGAASGHDGTLLLLRSYSALQFYRIHDDGFERIGGPHDLTPLSEPQGEGVALTAAGDVVLVGEAPGGGTIAALHCALPE